MSGLPNASYLVHIIVSGATVTRRSRNVKADVSASISKVTVLTTNF